MDENSTSTEIYVNNSNRWNYLLKQLFLNAIEAGGCLTKLLAADVGKKQ